MKSFNYLFIFICGIVLLSCRITEQEKLEHLLNQCIRMVLETEPKVHSRAIDEMREEVKELSNNVHSIERKQFGK